MSEVEYAVRFTDGEGVTRIRPWGGDLAMARLAAADYNKVDAFEADVVRRVVPDWEPISEGGQS